MLRYIKFNAMKTVIFWYNDDEDVTNFQTWIKNLNLDMNIRSNVSPFRLEIDIADEKAYTLFCLCYSKVKYNGPYTGHELFVLPRDAHHHR